MATLVLTAVGTAVGGPLGGALGALLGQPVDGALFAPKGRHGPRLGDLRVQTSSYGSAIPRIFGTMRVAGTVIWAPELKETKTKTGGGKGQPKQTGYSYSASFAVALSGRAILDVRRIWADGKLLRGAAGDLKVEGKVRLHRGGETQLGDPLIAATEGAGNAPAHRGIAYAVFEDLQLADYGNRIPSLTFEVVADAGDVSTGAIATALTGAAVDAEAGVPLGGFAAHGESVRAVLNTLAEIAPAPLADDGDRLRLGSNPEPVLTIEDDGAGEVARVAAATVPDAVTIAFHDPERDYQAGLQRVSLGGPGRRVDAVELPAVLGASAAKALAAARLQRHWATRERRVVTLPWRDLAVRPGRRVRLGDTGRLWRVAGWSFEKMAVRLELVGEVATPQPDMLPAVSGRATAAPDLRAGPTTLVLFDAPALGDVPEAAPRMLVAAAGAEPGWRGATLEASGDGGASWTAAGRTAPAAVIGHALGTLGAAGSAVFDHHGDVIVELLSDDMWLEGRDDDALVAGDNIALLGRELVQFGRAESLGVSRFRLTRLLRGRRGTEWAADAHEAGEPFVLLDVDSLASLPAPPERVGGPVAVAARGLGDGDTPAIAGDTVGVEAVRPPSPVHLRAERRADGTVALAWTRRSRAGWAWIDGVDAPLAEASERYRVVVLAGGAAVRTIVSDVAAAEYTSVMQATDGVAAGAAVVFEVTQVGSFAESRPARLEMQL